MIINIEHFYNARSAVKGRYGRLLSQLIAFACITLLCTNAFANGAANSTEYKLKAAYLYQFTKFTQWPGRLFIDKETPIQICILGKNPFGKSLDSFSGKVSQGRNLSIKYLSSPHNIVNCHVIFISKSEDKNLPQILQQIKKAPVLSVSDIDNFAQRGGIIGFVAKQRKLGLEINIDASRSSGAKISSKLLEVATVIREASP